MGIDDKAGCLRIDQDWNGTQKVCQRKENVGCKDEEISNDLRAAQKIIKYSDTFREHRATRSPSREGNSQILGRVNCMKT